VPNPIVGSAESNPTAEPAAHSEAIVGFSAGENSSSTNLARKIVTSVVWQSVAQVAGQIVSWLATLVVIRLVSPVDYGLMTEATLFLGFVFIFADLGVGSAAIQARSVEREQMRQLFGVVLISNLTLGVGAFLLAPLIAAFFQEPRLLLLTRVLSLNFVLIAATALPQAAVMRHLDFRTKSLIDVGATVTGSAVSLFVALAGGGVWALVWGMLLQSAARAVAYNVVRPMLFIPSFSFQNLGGFLRFGVTLSLDRIVFFMTGNIDLMIVGAVLGSEVVGLYTVALTLAALPFQKILPSVTQVSFVAFSRIQDDEERVRRSLLRALRIAATTCFPVLYGMAAVASTLIPLILGERWAAAATPLTIIALVLPLKVLNSVQSAALLGKGYARVNLTCMLITLALMAAGFTIGAQFGLPGMALSWVCMYPVAFLISTWLSNRALGVRMTDVLLATRPAFLAALSMLGIVTLLQLAMPVDITGWPRLIALIAAGVISYITIIYATDGEIRDLRPALLSLR
jgi:O-antigen/teichoic acid export membrane protein